MKKSTWIWTCGCGCAAVALVIGGLLALGVGLARRTSRGFDRAVKARATLEERVGVPESFVPPADGTIPADRMAAFLAVREATDPTAKALAASFAALPTDDEGEDQGDRPVVERLRRVVDVASTALSLGGRMGAFYESRNQALLQQGMGVGEYSYLYVIAYYRFLDRAAAADGGHVATPNLALGHLRGELRSMLRNQLDALPAEAPESWRRRLVAEVEALEADRDRLPWSEGLPETTAASLEPYRAALEGSFRAETDAFELASGQRSGRGRRAE